MTSKPYHSDAPRKRTSLPGERLHMDICGPMSVPSLGGSLYCLLFTDDHSNFKLVRFLTAKSQALDAWKQVHSEVETLTGNKVKSIKTDNGGEFVNTLWKEYCQQHRIRHDLSAPYSHQQNGVAERANRSILDAARSMLHAHGLARVLWAEAINTAVYVRNRTASRVINNMTPFELFMKQRPDVSNLRTFGCPVFAHKPLEKQSTLDTKSSQMIFIGYDANPTAYRVLDPHTKKITVRRTVAFDETNEPPQPMTDSVNLDSLPETSVSPNSPAAAPPAPAPTATTSCS